MEAAWKLQQVLVLLPNQSVAHDPYHVAVQTQEAGPFPVRFMWTAADLVAKIIHSFSIHAFSE
jgi:hypothetical protein